MDFTKKIISWYRKNKRDLPWRDTKDPYLIWISEIILQQTRVRQGLPYYMAFTKAFPTLEKLALAKEQTVLKIWQGLGYYSRAINLHQSAKYIFYDLGGNFPQEYDDVKNLKGIGTYTAAAICSFAYGKPYPVVDGNVYRVLARHFGIAKSIDAAEGKKAFHLLATETIDQTNPDVYNQAIMEFGALQCKPISPECSICPLAGSCWALSKNKITELPVRSKKIKSKIRHFNYLVIEHKGKTFINKREGQDIWKNLYEYPMIETTSKASKAQLKKLIESHSFISNATTYSINTPVRLDHQLTHQKIKAAFWEISLSNGNFQDTNLGCRPIKMKDWKGFPMHRLTERYLLTKKTSN